MTYKVTATIPQITYYVKKQLMDKSVSNIAIWLPGLTNKQLQALGRKFKSVKRGAMGYIEFTIEQWRLKE